jgi:hypothetical protein
MRMRVLGPLALVVVAGCTTEPLNTGDISLAQTVALTDQIVRIGLSGVASHPNAGGAGGAAIVLAPRGQVTFTLNYQQGCIEAGRIHVTGTVAGTLSDATGDGTLTVNAQESIESCAMTTGGSRFVLNGSTAITGTFVYSEGGPAADQAARVKGDFDWTATPGGPGRCHLDLLTSYNTATGQVAVTGQACGFNIAL